jgi:hypothetical protein
MRRHGARMSDVTQNAELRLITHRPTAHTHTHTHSLSLSLSLSLCFWVTFLTTPQNLAPGVDVTFTVRAFAGTDAGPPSPPLVAQTVPTVPAAPLAPEISGRTKTSLALKWAAVTVTGGRPIVSYELLGDNGDATLSPDAFPVLYSGSERRYKVRHTSDASGRGLDFGVLMWVSCLPSSTRLTRTFRPATRSRLLPSIVSACAP